MVHGNGTVEGEGSTKVRFRRKRSLIWEHFTAEVESHGSIRARCNHCKKILTYRSSSRGYHGTSHLKRHIDDACPMMKFKAPPSAHETESGGKGTAEKPSKRRRTSADNASDAVNQDSYSSRLAEMIILNDCSLHIVQQPNFASLIAGLQPRDKAVDIERVEAEVCAVYQREREILLKKFGSIPGRISLTARSWTSSGTSGYVAFTAQFIDSEWKLHQRMLNFMMVPRPFSDNAFREAIGKSLSQWKMEEKLFTITVDDSWSHLSKKNTLMLGGQIYVMRCYAHTLTEVAHDVIDSIQSAIYKIRKSIKFIKSCHRHEDKFSDLALELEISSDKTLCPWILQPSGTPHIRCCRPLWIISRY